MDTEVRQTQLARMEGLGQLTGGLAHDFNNLLTVIQGNLQALLDLPSVRSDPACEPLVNAALRAALRGADLTRSLLTFARKQQLAPEPVDVALMLNALLVMLRRTIDPRILLEFDAAPGCPACLADPGVLESVLLNIAINARDAMPDGGTLRCSIERVARLPDSALLSSDGDAEGAHGHVAISMRDTGSGMPEEVRERAFDPFFTTKPLGQGTGLGLSAAYGFVKQSRGAIELTSAPGRGTCVTLYLPIAPDAPVAAPMAPGTSLEALRRLDVMLVEDDLEVMAVLLSFLRELGCAVRAYTSGEHAWHALASDATPALLISDVTLGEGMRGNVLASRVRARWPELPVLLISGHPSDTLNGKGAPSDPPLLPKPFSREQLARAMSGLLAAP